MQSLQAKYLFLAFFIVPEVPRVSTFMGTFSLPTAFKEESSSMASFLLVIFKNCQPWFHIVP